MAKPKPEPERGEGRVKRCQFEKVTTYRLVYDKKKLVTGRHCGDFPQRDKPCFQIHERAYACQCFSDFCFNREMVAKAIEEFDKTDKFTMPDFGGDDSPKQLNGTAPGGGGAPEGGSVPEGGAATDGR